MTYRKSLAPLLAILLASTPAFALGGFGPNGGSSSGGGTVPGAVCGNDGVHALGWDGSAYVCYSITGTGGGVPSITGTANQITQVGSPGAVTLSLSATLVLPGTINGNTIPSASDTVVLLNAAQTLTNKSIVASQLTGALQAAQFPALTGDVTTVAGALATTLATVNANVGTFGSATQCDTATINGKGLTTAISQQACAPPFSAVTGNIALSQFPTLAADSIWLNATGSAAIPTAVAFPSCSTVSSALTYNTTSHALGCNTISGGSLAYTATFSGAVSGTPSAVGLGLDLAAANFTDNNTAGAGTAALFAAHSIETPVLLATNATVTTTHAATLYIANAPTASTNETISAKSAVYVSNGDFNMGTAGQKLQMFNVGTPGATNTESFTRLWTANVITDLFAKTGTGVSRNYTLDMTTAGGGIALKAGSGQTVSFVINGTTQFTLGATGLLSNSASGSTVMGNLAASATVPTLIPNRGSTTTGIGAQASGNISLTVAGAEIARVTGTAVTQIAGQTVLKSYTVAGLPTGITGGEVVVTDAVACTFAAAVTGGGTTFCPVYFNGTAWQAY